MAINDGFVRIGAATPVVRPAGCAGNCAAVLALMKEAANRGVQAMVFPELCVTGYTCGDLFNSATLIESAETALAELLAETAALPLLAVVGVPVAHGGALYNCAAVLCRGRLLGLAAKTNLPNHGEFYEARHFKPAPVCVALQYCGQSTFMGSGLLFRWRENPAFALGVEICEDLWVPHPTGAALTDAGATLLFNPSASDEIAGKAKRRRELVAGQSARLLCAYAYADAGDGESTTDLVFSGHNLIAENGALLSESLPFENGLICADIDLERLTQERRRVSTSRAEADVREIAFSMEQRPLAAERVFSQTPFVPADAALRDEHCAAVLQIQAAGLRGRLAATGIRDVVLGVSGGLDSTLALLVAVRAFDALRLPRAGIHAISMPGFGTTPRTQGNARALAQGLGASFAEIPIGAAVEQHFKDIGHDPANRDTTYENAQARERTQVLMDLANQCGGLVVGTGDLSELALGWATYNGDHMSMYGVNAGVPKTLVRHLVAFAALSEGEALAATLRDICDTPVSPELLPPAEGEIAQKTEELVGPYELHDFFLYYTMRFGFGPAKIYRMACRAFSQQEPEAVKRWLAVFFRRFFSQQFKRSCMPDGPKVGSVSLSPRGDWRMPSDACAGAWLEEIEAL